MGIFKKKNNGVACGVTFGDNRIEISDEMRSLAKEGRTLTIYYSEFGCKPCDVLKENLKKALEELGLDIDIRYSVDIKEMIELNIGVVPAMCIGELKISEGKSYSVEEIERFLQELYT